MVPPQLFPLRLFPVPPRKALALRTLLSPFSLLPSLPALSPHTQAIRGPFRNLDQRATHTSCRQPDRTPGLLTLYSKVMRSHLGPKALALSLPKTLSCPRSWPLPATTFRTLRSIHGDRGVGVMTLVALFPSSNRTPHSPGIGLILASDAFRFVIITFKMSSETAFSIWDIV